MATMTMTLIGMYNYDNTLFDNMVLPDEIDRETLIDSLLLKSGEFELLYPDADFMKSYIGTWSRKWHRTFSLWVKGQLADWNPIENYDRYEESNDGETSTHITAGTDHTSATGSNETEQKVSAYDSSSYEPSKKDTSTTGSGSDSTTNATNNGTLNRTHDSHIHGNIGVTESSTMLKNWYSISEWNIYDHIATVFMTEMCIPVY